MARSRPEACIFCGDSPCSCNKKATAAPVPRRRSVLKPPQSEPQVTPVAAPTPVSSAAQAAMRAKAAEMTPTLDEQKILEWAIKNLRELLAPEERQRLAALLSPASGRAKAWRDSRA